MGQMPASVRGTGTGAGMRKRRGTLLRKWRDIARRDSGPEAKERVAAIKAALTGELQPCRCDPPGSGEEFCNGGCITMGSHES